MLNMAAVTSNASQLLLKFQGCMVGALLGDCLGGPFESDFPVSKVVLTNYFTKLLEPFGKGPVQVQPYTDDTAMTRSVAKSLIENKEFDPVDMAKRFTEEYYRETHRGYGGNIGIIFRALRDSKYLNVFQPAREQFGGAGSLGNGAAMRIAPVALFYYNDKEKLVQVAEKSSQITHAHRHGYNGAILQCLAVHQALTTDPSSELDPKKFLDGLIEKVEHLEKEENNQTCNVGAKSNKTDYPRPFCTGLKTVKHIFESQQEDMSPEEVAVLLGNDVVAHKSVTTAIYAFLRSLQPLNIFESDNPFVRTIYFSIALGGDTDTIASMAGSIAGAYLGISCIPETLQKKCEGVEDAFELANKLYNLIDKKL